MNVTSRELELEKDYEMIPEDKISDELKLLKLDKDYKNIPEDKNNNIPEDKNNNIPEDKNNNIPEDKNNNIPEDKNNNILEDKNNNILEDKNNNIPEDKNNNVVTNIISDRAFPNIPNELSFLILSHLNQQNRIKLSRVSKAFRNLTYESILWREAIIYNTRGFGDNALQILKNVHYLDARASKLDDDFIRKLVSGSPGKSLRVVLDLSVNKITDKVIVDIGHNCQNLQKLYLEGCRNLTEVQPLRFLSPHLTTLILSHCSELSDESIEELISYLGPNLIKLDLDGCHRITNYGIYKISEHLNNLKYLAIDGQGIEDNSLLEIFKKCGFLNLFSMSFCDVLTDNSLDGIIQYLTPNLQFLRLRKGSEFTEEGFNRFFHGLSLRNHSFYSLDMSECLNITESNLNQMTHSKLRWLNLDWCWKLKEESLYKILTLYPELQEIMMTGCNEITYGIIQYLTPNLQFLRLRKGSEFTEEGFNRFFHGLSLRNHSFYSLDMSECLNITESNLNQMTHSKLRWLNLDWCWKLKEESLYKILTLYPELQEIMMTGCNEITCESLLDMKFPELKVLNLLSCRNVESDIIKKICELNKELYIIGYYGEVYKDGIQIGYHDDIYIEREEIELMVVYGREEEVKQLMVNMESLYKPINDLSHRMTFHHVCYRWSLLYQNIKSIFNLSKMALKEMSKSVIVELLKDRVTADNSPC
ncbi:hypothetical protein Glove_180g87 [Diversispora epigaea]|uniref:F-box domain-containing protein n=1 Tax=Diversispora epigaea TaxID=1348612 RepID=A0A397IWT1_9GLOM|nr:hypothetical protein Glove_180g87 [Diversispora epigaea]